MDGGTVQNINLVPAIDQCRAMGYDDTDIVIDILICGAPEIE